MLYPSVFRRPPTNFSHYWTCHTVLCDYFYMLYMVTWYTQVVILYCVTTLCVIHVICYMYTQVCWKQILSDLPLWHAIRVSLLCFEA